MSKPLTLSLSLAVALGLCSVSKAGGLGNCATCGLASPQGVVASPQGSYVSCEQPCKPKHHFNFNFNLKSCLPKHEVCYEWVLKKKHVWHRQAPTCTTCSAPVYATGQHVGPSAQHAVPTGQYAAPTVYGAAQKSAFLPARPATSIASVPAEMTPSAPAGEDVPPAPSVAGGTGGLLLPTQTPSGN